MNNQTNMKQAGQRKKDFAHNYYETFPQSTRICYGEKQILSG